jgi:hypothetical protein
MVSYEFWPSDAAGGSAIAYPDRCLALALLPVGFSNASAARRHQDYGRTTAMVVGGTGIARGSRMKAENANGGRIQPVTGDAHL